MDEKPDQIVEHIESQRHALGRNLDELQHRIKSTADWRVQFDRHPMAAVGLAMGGGLLLGAMVGGRSGKYRSSRASWRKSSGLSGKSSMPSASPVSTSSSLMSSSSAASIPPGTEYQRSRAMETVDNLKGALMGYFSAMAKDWVNDLLPGFHEHYEDTSRRNQSRGVSSQPSGYGSSQTTTGTGQGSSQTPGSPTHSGSYNPTEAHGSNWQSQAHREPTPAL